LFFYQKIKLDRKASVLVVCLWMVMILSILGISLGGFVFQLIRFSKSYESKILSLPLAKAAVKSIFYIREKDTTAQFDTFEELSEEKSIILCRNNSYKYFLGDKNGDALVDESALININTVSSEVLERLPGMEKELAEKILNSGLRPFSSINELFLVEGMDKEKFMQFKDLITVYGTGKININTASRAVLLALGLDSETADIILRAQKEYKIQNPDPYSNLDLGHGFETTGKILDVLRSLSTLSIVQEQSILSLLSVLDVKSEYLRLNVMALPSGKEGLRYSILIYPATKKILSWSEF